LHSNSINSKAYKYSVQFFLIVILTQSAFAATDVEKALTAARILPKGYAFRVSSVDSEATVQTYQSSKSPTISDMKIDAVLIAKVVTERLPKVAKVRVQFYKPDQSGYSLVSVTVGDITAYGLGGISKEKLLQSLEVTTAGSPRFTKAEAAGLSVFQADRLKFFRPTAWSPATVSGDGYIAKWLVPGSKSWAELFVRKQDAPSPEAQAGYDANYGESHGSKVVRRQAVQVGRQHLPGYELLLEGPDPSHPNEAPARYDHHIYFGSAGYIFSVTLNCPIPDSAAFSPTFGKILESIELQPAGR
jgi:hypothetical protein